MAKAKLSINATAIDMRSILSMLSVCPRGGRKTYKDDSSERMKVIELKDHPWFIDGQFHLEYPSRVP